MPANYPIRGMTVPEVLDTAIGLMRDHFQSFLLVALIAFPISAANGVTQHYLGEGSLLDVLFGEDEEDEEESGILDLSEELEDGAVANPTLDNVDTVLIFVDLLIVTPFVTGALVMLGSALYLGKTMTPGAALGQALRRLPELSVAEIGYILIVILGLILLIVPGVIWGLRYLLYVNTLMFERTGVGASFTRSAQLQEGRLGDAFAISALVVVIAMLAMFVEVIPFWPVRVAVVSLVECVLLIFGSLLTVVYYFSCRCKRENFDLQYLAVESGQEQPAGQPEAGVQ